LTQERSCEVDTEKTERITVGAEIRMLSRRTSRGSIRRLRAGLPAARGGQGGRCSRSGDVETFALIECKQGLGGSAYNAVLYP
jgi:hypothetical protein